ncbi:MAG: hypothetical protein GWP04_00820 [Gammaproteobacteria bacterium]|nr:hypothetical protein [Gammaproteobacteria bacterium]
MSHRKKQFLLVAVLLVFAMVASGCYTIKNAYINKTQLVYGESMTAVIQLRSVSDLQGRPTVWVLMPDDWSIGALKDFDSDTMGHHPLGTNFSAKLWVETAGNCVQDGFDVGGPAPTGYVWKALRVTDGDLLPSGTTEIQRVRVQLVAGSTAQTVGIRFVTGTTVDESGNPGTVDYGICAGIYVPTVTVSAP